MNPAASASHSLPPAPIRRNGTEDPLRAVLRRCSETTFIAAREFRRTHNPELIGPILWGIVERYCDKSLRPAGGLPSGNRRLTEDLGIDSLALMEMTLVAEEVFQVSIEYDELKGLRTVDDLGEFIGRKVLPAPLPPPLTPQTHDRETTAG